MNAALRLGRALILILILILNAALRLGRAMPYCTVMWLRYEGDVMRPNTVWHDVARGRMVTCTYIYIYIYIYIIIIPCGEAWYGTWWYVMVRCAAP